VSDDRKRHWLLWDPVELERVKRLLSDYVPQLRPGEIVAHNLDPLVDQVYFAFGDPGTIAGHTLDTANADRTAQEDGNGNYAFFLRIQLNQTRTNNDQNNTRTYKLQYQVNGTGGTWLDVTASSTHIQAVDDSNNADGAAVTSARVQTTDYTYANGEYDEVDGVLDAITWATNTQATREMVWSLLAIDSQLSASDVVYFRVIESGGTLLNNSASADFPALTWAASDTPRSVTDGFSLADTLVGSIPATRSLTDGFSLAENITTAWTEPPVSETVAFSDTASHADNTRQVTDALTLADTIALNVGQAVADNLTFADTVATQADFAQAVTDALTLADTLASPAAFSQAIVDALTLADAISLIAAFQQAITDDVTFADVTSYPDTARAITDDLTLADTVAVNVGTAVVDGVGIDDAVVYTDIARAITDALTLADTVAERADFAQAITDALTLDDAPALNVGTALAETLALADTLGRDYADTITDGVGFNDTPTAGVATAITDNLTLNDTPTTLASFIQAILDTVAVDDTPTYPDAARSVVDSLTFADTVALGVATSVTDGFSLAEDMTTSVTADTGAETVALADTVSVVPSFKRSITDDLTLADVATYGDTERLITDGLSLDDTLAPAAGFQQAIADDVTLADAPTIASGYNVSVTDGFSLSDSPVVLGAFKVTNVDGFSLDDANTATLSSRARVTAFELELPDAPRAVRVSAFEFQLTDAPRAAQITAFELEMPDAPDVTAPILSSPSVTPGVTTGTGQVTTDEGNGTLYWVVTTSATAPSVAQVQAGQDHLGASAVASGNQAVTASGVQLFGIVGLSPSTAYYMHAQQQDAATNDSTVVTSAEFTTGAGGGSSHSRKLRRWRRT